MKTAIQIFLKQTRRSTKRLVLQFVLLCAATVFFVVSLNLYANSMRNLQTADNAYTTIATAEFYGYVAEDGMLVHPGDEDCIGQYLLSIEKYDFSLFSNLDYVNDIHLRTRVGAYIPGHIQVSRDVSNSPAFPSDYRELSRKENVIRFVLDAEEPVTFSLCGGTNYYQVPLRILEQSNPLLVYPTQSNAYWLSVNKLLEKDRHWYADDIRRLNRSDVTDAVTLYPGVEYVLNTGSAGFFWVKDEASGKYIWQEDVGYHDEKTGELVRYSGIAFFVGGLDLYRTYSLGYVRDFGMIALDTAHPEKDRFSLQRYEDVQGDTDWSKSTQVGEYNGSSFAAVLTDDISLVPAWHQGAMFLNEGRMITKEEYETGAKVCMVSTKMAYLQGWKVGDKLDLHLYEFDAFFDVPAENLTGDHYTSTPIYTYDCEGFFDEGTYEIVGIFGRKELLDTGETSPQVFLNPWDCIYIPANSAPNAPGGPVQTSLLTFHLQNGSIDAFKAAVEEVGLTDQVPGEYEIKFSYFDQGYSKIAGGLQEMNRNAKILLGLSAALLAVTMVLTAFLFSRQHKHSAGILRMLGGSKKQAFTAILVCAAAVVAAGGIVGTVLGGALTQSVGASILGDTEAAVELATGASPLLTALTGAGCIALFLLLTAIFTATYIGKEPRQLLPKDGA